MGVTANTTTDKPSYNGGYYSLPFAIARCTNHVPGRAGVVYSGARYRPGYYRELRVADVVIFYLVIFPTPWYVQILFDPVKSQLTACLPHADFDVLS